MLHFITTVHPFRTTAIEFLGDAHAGFSCTTLSHLPMTPYNLAGYSIVGI